MSLEDSRAERALKDAEEALQRAYAPYSGFRMGALRRMVDDRPA